MDIINLLIEGFGYFDVSKGQGYSSVIDLLERRNATYHATEKKDIIKWNEVQFFFEDGVLSMIAYTLSETLSEAALMEELDNSNIPRENDEAFSMDGQTAIRIVTNNSFRFFIDDDTRVVERIFIE